MSGKVAVRVRASTRRIVILGKTGSGKSSLANTIFEEERFTIGHGLNSATKKCQAETKSVNGRNITLIDTPGFFDTDRSEEDLKCEIVRCITECAPGPHAFLIVLQVERFTEHKQAVINNINELFSEEVFKYATVLFTHGDQLPEGQKIEDHVHQNKLLSDLVKKCGGRCHVIDNKYWNKNPENEYRNNQFQVSELLKTIEKMLEANNGSYYTNEMLQAVEEEIQEEEVLIRQSSGNTSEEEIREHRLGAFVGAAATDVPVLASAPVAGRVLRVMGAKIVAATAVAVGAMIIGGLIGSVAGKKANTPQAAKRAGEAVKNETQSVSNKADDALDGQSEAKLKQKNL